MAIQGNFKGTTQSVFQIGKHGTTLHGKGAPDSPENGDIWFDKTTKKISVYDSNVSVWESIGSHLAGLNVDNGTLFVDHIADTVSIGSEASNEKLFVNGNLRLGTNPSFQHGGAYMDLRHSNGGTTNIRVRDNTGGTDPIFKVFNASNTSEVFRVQGNVTIHDYTMPAADGAVGQALITNGAGQLSFADIATTPAGANTAVQFNDGGSFGSDTEFTYDTATNTLTVTNLTVTNTFNQVTDYGFITDSTSSTSDYGAVTEPDPYLPSQKRYTEVTTSYAIVPGDRIIVDSTTAAITVTLPANPVLGDEVRIIDGGLNASVNNITIDRNGSNIDGTASNMTVNTNGAAFGLVYYNSAIGWLLTER